jgi:nucleoside-triphosphatase THEP1
MNVKFNTKTVGIIGMKGSGKTYHTRELAEALGKNCIIFDTIGALKVKSAQKYAADVGQMEKEGVAFGLMIKEVKSKSISINLNRYTREEVVDFTNYALGVAGEIKKKYIIVDEIADYLPQMGRQSKEMERLIRHGRNFGDTFIFNTQRPAYINKNTWDLVDILIVFRTVWNRDIEVLKEMLSNLGKTNKEIEPVIHTITKLPVGKYAMFVFSS